MSIPPSKNNDKNQLRMDPESTFRFSCSPGVPCFTRCCRDVTIVLTPYDVLRLKNALNISSSLFLDKYTIIAPREKRLIPMVILKMNDHNKQCPFVDEEGCTVYTNRPWPCRMFPLDMNDDGTFRLITNGSNCHGLNEDQKQPISWWLAEQGIPIFDEMNFLFSEVIRPLQTEELDIDNPKIYQMTFMALYNLDKFKDFVFKSTFFDRFEVDPVTIEKIKRHDIELLKFGFDWIKFGILGQKTFAVKEGVFAKDINPQ